MRILIVTQYFWPENFRINDLALGLKEKGHDVIVLTGMPNYPGGRFFPGYGFFKKKVEHYHGVEILRVPLLPRGRSRGARLALNYFSFAFLASMLAPFYCRGKFDVIFVFQTSPVTVGIPAIVLKKLKGIPIQFWVLDLWPESLSATGTIKSPTILGLVSVLVRFIYHQCDQILVSSRGFIPGIKHMAGEDRSICYFPNWAEELYRPMTQDKEFEIKGIPDGFRIMFAGNIGAAQDFGTILSAAEKLKDNAELHWLILGDGRMSGWVRKEIQIRGLTANVHMLGRHPPETMPLYFSMADAMLVSLKSDPIFSLTIPGKIQSYLASGKPIIAALDGEGGSIVTESGAGLVCPPENPEALAEAVMNLYRTPIVEREKMGMKGRIYSMAHFERTMLIERIEGWMKELSKKKKTNGNR